jgi:hypothetical protein
MRRAGLKGWSLEELVAEIQKLAAAGQQLYPDVTRDDVREWAGLNWIERRRLGLDSHRVYLLEACVFLGSSGKTEQEARVIVNRWPVAMVARAQMSGEGTGDDVVH